VVEGPQITATVTTGPTLIGRIVTGARGVEGPQGEQGIQGETGDDGVYIGTDAPSTNQLWLDTDDTTAQYPDKYYTEEFVNQSTITVTHNLDKYPSVTVTDTAYSVVEGDITYLDSNSLTVAFSASFSGAIMCN
jgi:hypothetical protein